ncbi:hypothetical protein [Hoeflea sp.]|uniref:hypothetical protein n=1 Tax=Hoeflea sp. TaxID=1940281 RepID=UPI003BB06766
MNDLLNVSFDFQAMLVAGYFGYKISSMGLARVHRTEDFLLQVLAFAVVSKIISALSVVLLTEIPGLIEIEWVSPFITMFAGVLVGAFWRKYGETRFSKLMENRDISRDDHEASVWMSIAHSKSRFTFVQVMMRNGTTLESDFDLIPQSPPFPPLKINEDGISIYVTKIWPSDDQAEQVFEPVIDKELGIMRLRYIPRSEIEQIEWCLRKR